MGLFNINKRFIILKVHYFLLFSGLGGINPFLALVGKGLGISATAVGLCYTFNKFCILITRPGIAFITDHFRNIKTVIISLVLVSNTLLFSLIFLPPIPHEEQNKQASVHNFTVSEELYLLNLPQTYEQKCLEQMSNLTCYTEKDISYSSKENVTQIVSSDSIRQPVSFEVRRTFKNNDSIKMILLLQNNMHNLSDVPNHQKDLSCHEDIEKCLVHQTESLGDVLRTYQFWIFGLAIIGLGIGYGNSFSLTDSLCCDVLGPENQGRYGQQRLWGTISYAVCCSIAGNLNDYLSAQSGRQVYVSGFYMLLVAILIDVVVISKIPSNMEKKTQKESCKKRGVKSLFKSPEVLIFALGVIANGVLSSSYEFEFWYIQDLGASQALVGSVVLVQCLASEVPVFFIAGWLIEKLGCFNCLVGSFLAYAVRMGSLTLISDPRWVLAIDATHGFTFGLYYSAMTHFATQNAPEGLQATMLATLSALSEGIGQSAGSTAIGAGIDRLGGRPTFGILSGFSIVCALVFFVAPHIIRCCSAKEKKQIKEIDSF